MSAINIQTFTTNSSFVSVKEGLRATRRNMNGSEAERTVLGNLFSSRWDNTRLRHLKKKKTNIQISYICGACGTSHSSVYLNPCIINYNSKWLISGSLTQCYLFPRPEPAFPISFAGGRPYHMNPNSLIDLTI